MSDPSSPALSVSFTLDDAVAIAQALGAAASLIVPGEAAAVAAVSGIATLLGKTVIPAIQRAQETQMSVARQAQIAADAAVSRAKAGAPPATIS